MNVKENNKGFLLLNVSGLETLKIGGCGVCDSCGKPADKGVLVCVLNMWYCNACFQRWYDKAKRYQEDVDYEKTTFERYSNILNSIDNIKNLKK